MQLIIRLYCIPLVQFATRGDRVIISRTPQNMINTASLQTLRLPIATYRLQFNHLFTFAQAAALVDYLAELGISDVYASPLFKARRGSLHGYDITDHSRLNPELGNRAEFEQFSDQLNQRGMGLLVDVVPNHMCIAGNENQWWLDVLENGPGSPFAHYLDIDWQPPKEALANRVLLPVLGDQFGRVLEEQQIKLSYQRGAFLANYYETQLPIAPRTSMAILKDVLTLIKTRLDEYHPQVLELESIITALTHLPARTEIAPAKVKERRREKDIVRRRTSRLASASREVRRAIEQVINEYNGQPHNARSFDRLEELLDAQAYRLCYWRVAADEINYRRFFDVNELAAIRVEEPKVFAAVHELIFRLLKEGRVTGLRVDHIDGLLDPEQYLRELQRHARKALQQPPPRPTGRLRLPTTAPPSIYVVVEKILGHDEKLRANWATQGTTGYDFLNLLNGVFIEPASAAAFQKLYQRFTGLKADFARQAYDCRKLILQVAMSSELRVLSRRLERISEQQRNSRDFTLNSLQAALGEVIACFPVYRSYHCPHLSEVNEEDRRHINLAIKLAKGRNPAVSPTIFDFIAGLLLLHNPEVLSEEQRRERREFVLRFQQLTGPVTAKGVEDTAFYRRYPLASLCEVGGEPSHFGVTRERFHRQNEQRLANWPQALLATSTHDTKRSEDVRARLNVLSEIPGRWYHAARRWQRHNEKHKTQIEGQAAPNANEEYLLYQTLIGTWPFEPLSDQERAAYITRIQEYLNKALREAKLHSSWINQNEEYEQAVRHFAWAILNDAEFVNDFSGFQQPLARPGMCNALAQTLLKLTAPGVPDFYQGTESWNFSLVDPDNRRPVDYARLREMLAQLRVSDEQGRAALVDTLLDRAADGRIKLYLTQRLLQFRRTQPELFARGSYEPLVVEGARAEHVIAFARRWQERTVVVVATRFFTRLLGERAWPLGAEIWGSTSLALAGDLAGCYQDVLAGRQVCTQTQAGGASLSLADICAHLPVALLERV